MSTSSPDSTRAFPREEPFASGPGAASLLRARYEAYCHRQILRLLALMPRNAVRSIYRRARQDLLESRAGAGFEGGSKDPMEALVSFCRRTLPLPPFEVWCEDVRLHPAAHVDDGDSPNGDAGSDSMVHLALRLLDLGDDRWTASLDARPDGGWWRGRVAFRHSADDDRVYHTGEIFREASAEGVRARFMEFDQRTLKAFLRSVTP